MKTVFRLLAIAMALVLLAGCSVQVNPTTTATATTTTATATASTTIETTASSAPTEVPISDFRFTSDPGSPNTREELTKTWPEFAKDDTAKVVCFEMGWTGPVKEKDIVTPEIAKRTGFTIVYEPMTVNSTDEYNQKLNLMVSSGDVPDIFFGGGDAYTLDVYEKLGQANLIYDMGKYLPSYKNVYNLLLPELIKFARTDSSGTHDWMIPTQTSRSNDMAHKAGGGIILRKDFLDQLKMDWPTTTDQLKTYLERCRDEIKVNGEPALPMELDEGLSAIGFIANCFYPLGGYSYFSTQGGFGFDWTNNFKPYNYQYTNSPELIKAMKYLNSLYTEGLIDKECVSIKQDQINAKISSGRVMAATGTWWSINPYADAAKASVPDIMYAASKPIQDAENPTILRKWTGSINMPSTIICSTKLSEDTVKHFCAMLDYFGTLNGQMLVFAGIPGETFNINSEGKFQFTEQFKSDTSNLDWVKEAAYGLGYWQQLVFDEPLYIPLEAQFTELVRPDNYLGWENQKPILDLYDYSMIPPKDYYYIAGPVEKDKLQSLNDAYTKLVADCILAKDGAAVEKLVNDYAAQCKTLGIDEVMAERQQLIDKIQVAN